METMGEIRKATFERLGDNEIKNKRDVSGKYVNQFMEGYLMSQPKL
jgi:hypothetical protein